MMYRFLFFILTSTMLFSQNQNVLIASYANKTIKKPTIILDAGHGGLDKGAKIKYPYLEEKRLTLSTVLLTKKQLELLGYNVVLTRDKDFFVPLDKRVNFANDNKAEIFISIHFNSCPNKIAKGIEVYYHNSLEDKKRSKSSKNLAHSILSFVCQKTNAKSRGVKNGRYVVVRDTKMPAILLEAGFLTNPEERDNVRKRIYQEKISKGIAEGIENFLKKYI